MTHLDDDEIDDIPRTVIEIARRALVLSAVITTAYGAPTKEIKEWLKLEGLWDEITPQELKFLNNPKSKRDHINFTWKIECLVVLLWCIHKLDVLTAPIDQCDTEQLKKVIVFPPEKTADFISTSILRDEDEILNEHYNIYKAHRKIRDAELNHKKNPDNLDSGVVLERHYAFNWVIGYMGQSWDDISLDV